jgi:hypothetical protein
LSQETDTAKSYRDLIGALSKIKFQKNLQKRTVYIAKNSITVYSTRQNYVEAFTQTLMNVETQSHGSNVSIYLLPKEDLPLDFILQPFQYGHYQDQETSFMHNTNNNSIEIFDKKNLVLYILSPNIDEFIETILYSNLHYLKQVLNRLGHINMHGAVVGRDGTGIFLANKGGSGKSSLMAYSLYRGMQTLGDDFLTLDAHDPYVFYSIFRHFKLNNSSPAYRLIKGSFNPMGQQRDGKDIFEIPEILLQRKMRVKEILIPFLGKNIGISEISKDDALRKLLPSTLFLNHTVALTIATMKVLIDEIPVYSLELNPNMEQAYELLEERLVN